MTRKEEISEQCFVNGFNDHDKEIFSIGVEWADSRPRKGLVDIDKACEWLKVNLITVVTDDYTYTASVHNISRKEFIEQFKKAMEEQL